MKRINVEYDSNNSGGNWWLKDEDWLTLEKAGWHIHWVKDNPYSSPLSKREVKRTGRWLGALATNACIYVDANDDGEAEQIAEVMWENALGMNADEEGCSCCGNPHSFYSMFVCAWVKDD